MLIHELSVILVTVNAVRLIRYRSRKAAKRGSATVLSHGVGTDVGRQAT